MKRKVAWYRARLVKCHDGQRSVSDTQEKIDGWIQGRVHDSHIVQIGNGGIGGQIAMPAAKIGVGMISLCDPDVVDASNVNRQLFGSRDIGRFKAHALARIITRLSGLGTIAAGYPLYFSDFLAANPMMQPTVVVSGVDNNRCRREVEDWCLSIGVPHIAIGIARDASAAYLFVQEPGHACLGCYVGERLADQNRSPCPGTPAVLDVLQTVCGFATYALSTLLTDRKRSFNLVHVTMASGTATSAVVPIRDDCQFCSNRGTR